MVQAGKMRSRIKALRVEGKVESGVIWTVELTT